MKLKNTILFTISILLTFLFCSCSIPKETLPLSEYIIENNVDHSMMPSASTIQLPSGKDFKLELLKNYFNKDYYTLTYKITNTSKYYSYTYVEVKVELQDENGVALASDWTYAVGSEGLDAGDSNEFTIMIDKPSEKVVNASCRVIGFE